LGMGWGTTVCEAIAVNRPPGGWKSTFRDVRHAGARGRDRFFWVATHGSSPALGSEGDPQTRMMADGGPTRADLSGDALHHETALLMRSLCPDMAKDRSRSGLRKYQDVPMIVVVGWPCWPLADGLASCGGHILRGSWFDATLDGNSASNMWGSRALSTRGRIAHQLGVALVRRRRMDKTIHALPFSSQAGLHVGVDCEYTAFG